MAAESGESRWVRWPVWLTRERRIGMFVALFLVLQIALPLRYYVRAFRLGDAAARADERFAWRMFSSYSREVRDDLPNREATVYETSAAAEDEKRLPLRSLVTRRWIRFVLREREDVIRQMLLWRQSQAGVTAARIEVTRFGQDGSPIVLASYSLDADRKLVRRQ